MDGPAASAPCFAATVQVVLDRERERQDHLKQLRGSSDVDEPACGWPTFDEHTITANQERAVDLVELLDSCARVLDVLRLLGKEVGNTFTSDDVGRSFNCGEADALAKAMLEGGQENAAVCWITGHADADEEGDLHYGFDERSARHYLARRPE